ncbi:MAG: LysR family transcriptional regulator [Immundisolibacteraceae bacterium]|nr:LysR family transcriptional regulator [Immundisolibacteraceae bacterium]
MSDLNEMAVFASVVDAGSFTGAALKLDQPKSTISRRITRLEQRLGVRLLQRTTRALHLTDAGEIYYHYCARIAAEAQSAEDAINNTKAEPSGPVKITAPIHLSAILPGLIDEFMALYPKVQIHLFCNDAVLDIVNEGIDVAFRFGKLNDSSFIARKLGSHRPILCAAESYLASAPQLEKPADLVNHHCISFNPPPNGSRWNFEGPDGKSSFDIPPRLAVNNLEIMHRSALAGIGVAILPALLCQPDIEAGKLRALLPSWSFSSVELNLVYPSSRLLPTKVRAFIDFTLEKFRSQGMGILMG